MGKRPRGGATSGQSTFSSPSTAKCFIGGLSQMTDSDKLVHYFETKYAPYKVYMCEVMYDKDTTRSRGFGFVTMDVRAVAAAVDDQARDRFCHQLDGKNFEVRPATPVGASPPPAPPGVGIVNRPVNDLDALLMGAAPARAPFHQTGAAPARAPAFRPSAPRSGGYTMPPNGAPAFHPNAPRPGGYNLPPNGPGGYNMSPPNGAGYNMPPPNAAMYAPPPANFSLKDICRDFTNGRCTRGDGCKYVHAGNAGAPPPGAHQSGWMPPGPPQNGWRQPDGPPPNNWQQPDVGWWPPDAGPPMNGGWRPPDVGPPLGGGFGGGSHAGRGGSFDPPPQSGPSDAASAALTTMRAIETGMKRQRVQPAAPTMPYVASPEQRCNDWIASTGVDSAASSLFNESPLAVKLAAMDTGPVTGKNPSACLVARVIRLKRAHREGGLPHRDF